MLVGSDMNVSAQYQANVPRPRPSAATPDATLLNPMTRALRKNTATDNAVAIIPSIGTM